ncbi:MAG: FixH family protein, partial [Maribacter sp.]|nr:FixH family protein [Maribacter sp.]
MKINWGTGILMAFIAFISFILFFVVKMSMDDRANHDLVTKEYYKAELGYQKEINAETNASNLSEKLSIRKTSEGLLVQFPKNINPEKIEGTVSL